MEVVKKEQLKRRVFTLECKAEVVRHKKAENLSWADCGRKFDVLPKLVQQWEKQYKAGELAATAGRRAVSPEQAEITRLRAELGDYPLSIVCRVLGVTQAGYHAWHGKMPSRRDNERDDLRANIRSVFDAQRGRYGAPRVYRVLRAQHGYTGSLNRIQALMRAMGPRAKSR